VLMDPIFPAATYFEKCPTGERIGAPRFGSSFQLAPSGRRGRVISPRKIRSGLGHAKYARSLHSASVLDRASRGLPGASGRPRKARFKAEALLRDLVYLEWFFARTAGTRPGPLRPDLSGVYDFVCSVCVQGMTGWGARCG
jgi:hypothetical protein